MMRMKLAANDGSGGGGGTVVAGWGEAVVVANVEFLSATKNLSNSVYIWKDGEIG